MRPSDQRGLSDTQVLPVPMRIDEAEKDRPVEGDEPYAKLVEHVPPGAVSACCPGVPCSRNTGWPSGFPVYCTAIFQPSAERTKIVKAPAEWRVTRS